MMVIHPLVWLLVKGLESLYWNAGRTVQLNIIHYALQTQINMRSIVDTCNLFRTFDEMEDSWETLHALLRYYNNYNKNNKMYNYSGPGSFNDPDQVWKHTVRVTRCSASSKLCRKTKSVFTSSNSNMVFTVQCCWCCVWFVVSEWCSNVSLKFFPS